MQEPRARLQKAQKDLIVKTLEEATKQDGPFNGMTIRVGFDWVWCWNDGEPYFGIRWSTKHRCWKGYLPTIVLSHEDLDTYQSFVQRQTLLIEEIIKAWQDYKKSKSEKDWRIYQGIVAALYSGGPL